MFEGVCQGKSSPRSVKIMSMATHVDTLSRHEVLSWISEHVRTGRFRKCGHLGIKQVSKYQDDFDTSPIHPFVPHCDKDSFDWKGDASLYRGTRLDTLVSRLRISPISCPEDCRCYEPRNWTKVKGAGSKAKSAVSGWLGAVIERFLKLPWQTQVAIIGLVLIVVVLALARKEIPHIIEFLKVILGK